MKKNLVALAVLLVLVAVAAQFTRHGGKKSEWVALETDMQACLQLLWQQPDQKVEIMPSEGGPMAFVTVRMPPQAKAGWNFPFLNFVAARHPAVQLKGISILDALTGNPLLPENSSSTENSFSSAQPASSDSQRRAELLRRQGQAVADEQLGTGQGLVLVDIREVAATPINVESNFERQGRTGPALPMEAAPERQGKSARSVREHVEKAEGMRSDQATSPPPPQFQVEACLVFATQPPPDKVDRIVSSLNLNNANGDAMRIVNLPPR